MLLSLDRPTATLPSTNAYGCTRWYSSNVEGNAEPGNPIGVREKAVHTCMCRKKVRIGTDFFRFFRILQKRAESIHTLSEPKNTPNRNPNLRKRSDFFAGGPQRTAADGRGVPIQGGSVAPVHVGVDCSLIERGLLVPLYRVVTARVWQRVSVPALIGHHRQHDDRSL